MLLDPDTNGSLLLMRLHTSVDVSKQHCCMLCQLLCARRCTMHGVFSRQNVVNARQKARETLLTAWDPDTTLLMYGGIGKGKLAAHVRSMQGFDNRVYTVATQLDANKTADSKVVMWWVPSWHDAEPTDFIERIMSIKVIAQGTARASMTRMQPKQSELWIVTVHKMGESKV